MSGMSAVRTKTWPESRPSAFTYLSITARHGL
jgi:hypothetical protein